VNVKEYISSGIIESYVMGMATDVERHEFEAVCAQYPEIAEARNAFELALEEQLLTSTSQPPVHLKQLIEGKVLSTAVDIDVANVEPDEIQVRRIGPWKWLAAASIILLAATAFWAITTNNKYIELQAAHNNLQNQLQQSTAQLDTLKQEASLLQKPGIMMATMKGTSDPGIYATIYWDTTSANKDVYLMVNNLPETTSDKQYQLWALLNGQPIDLGMIEARQQRLLLRMKNVQSAEAFAITLEPKGGSATPTSAPLVLGKL